VRKSGRDYGGGRNGKEREGMGGVKDGKKEWYLCLRDTKGWVGIEKKAS